LSTLTEALPEVRDWRSRLFQPVDIASLVVFRIGFGLMLAGWALHYLWIGRVVDMYVAPRFHFTYPGLDFIRPWGGLGMKLHFLGLALLGLLVALGLAYRFSSLLLALGFTYVFLLDRANYQNHYYLLALLSWSMPLMPTHRALSLDALNGAVGRRGDIPAWCLMLTRFHIGILYFFGGVAKINSDWLAGEPMRTHLLTSEWGAALGNWFSSEPMVLLLAWGGLLFDLAVVPMLLWKRTRVLAYLACLVFHLMNSQLFQIHVFPWFMIVATTIFFEPGWPRRFLRLPKFAPPTAELPAVPPTGKRRLGLSLLVIYTAVHLLLPFRHLLYEGDTNWTEQGHHFAWRMMLRGKTSGVRFLLTDRATGETLQADLLQFISPEQLTRMARDPEMIVHAAHQLREAYLKLTGRDFEVRAIVLSSLNGRPPQLLVDPNMDLSEVPRNSWNRPWVQPQNEPLPNTPWTIPVQEWERYIPLPELDVLRRRNAADGKPASAPH
jgi:vitamin K-dependent gamma-carboxylase